MKLRISAGLIALILASSQSEASPYEGEQLYDASDFEGAERKYSEAYSETGDLQVLLKLGDAQRRLGDFDKALATYKRFMRRTAQGEEGRSRARLLIAQLSTAIERRKLGVAPREHESHAFEFPADVAESAGTDWNRVGFYTSLSALALSTTFTFYNAHRLRELEENKDAAWTNLATLDPDAYQEIVGAAGISGVVKDACGKAQTVARDMPSTSLATFVSTCQEGLRTASLGNVGYSAMLLGALGSAYFGYKTWGSSRENTWMRPAVGPTSDGGLQGNVTFSF